MKIGLIEPRTKEQSFMVYHKPLNRFLKKNPRFFPAFTTPNLGLLTIAALIPKGWQVKYIDSLISEIDYREAFDIIALSGLTCQAEEMAEISRKFRQRGSYIVAGGIHATVRPEEILEFADTVLIGEAEETFPRFIDDFQNQRPKRTYQTDIFIDLSKSPVPRFDLLAKEHQNFPVQTTRGCPHKCKFCAASVVYGEGYRHKDPDQVVEEIKFLKTINPNPFIIFSDDNMFVNKSFTIPLLEKLIPLDIKFHSLTDISIGKDENLLRLLYQAGCKEVFIGFENLVPEVLEKYVQSRWKAKHVPEYKSLIQNIQNHGIRVYGAFILGLESDTKDDVQRIKDFFQETKIIGQTTILTPFPGTALFQEYQKSNRILKDKSWKYYTGMDCVIKHNNFSPDELESSITEIFEFVYSKGHTTQVMRKLVDSTLQRQ